MKFFHSTHSNENGFALITAIMMLFAATVMGLMVMNSSEIEILLSGAQQRYENNFNTVDGAISRETRTLPIPNGYVTPNQILSPTTPGNADFDPDNDMTEDEDFVYTVVVDPDPNIDTPPERWPMNNLLNSADAANNRFDYHYRTIYRGIGDTTPTGYDATSGGYSAYLFEVSTSRTTQIQIGSFIVGNSIE